MTSGTPKLKTEGEDITYPVHNQIDLKTGIWNVLDAYGHFVCDCLCQKTAVAITGLLNQWKPNEWK